MGGKDNAPRTLKSLLFVMTLFSDKSFCSKIFSLSSALLERKVTNFENWEDESASQRARPAGLIQSVVGVNHYRLHCRLAQSRGLMRRGKYGAVIGQKMRFFVCAQYELPGYGFLFSQS